MPAEVAGSLLYSRWGQTLGVLPNLSVWVGLGPRWEHPYAFLLTVLLRWVGIKLTTRPAALVVKSGGLSVTRAINSITPAFWRAVQTNHPCPPALGTPQLACSWFYTEPLSGSGPALPPQTGG